MTIFEYTNYKDFLREKIANLPKGGRGEVNRIALHLHVHPTLVSQVLNGQRDFSVEQIHRLCSYLGLPPLEADFLILLLQHERAGTNELKKYYRTKIEELRKSSLKVANRLKEHVTLSDYERAIFYSSWLYMAVWLLTSIDDGKTIDAVSERLSISRARASEILTYLKNVQLCSEKNGVYQMQSQHIHVEFGSPFLARHHTHWRLKSLERIEDLTEEELMFTSPFSVSKRDFGKIREEVIKLIKNTSAVIKDSPAEDIACLNLELFWIKK
jgi:uncharacterized protein (TIGR02147 family)